MASLEEIRIARLKKLQKLLEAGVDPYPAKTGRDFEIKRLIKEFDSLQRENKTVTIAGRVMALRSQGAIAFADIFDGTGLSAQSGKFQVLFKKGEGIDDKNFNLFIETVDIGDFIEASCTLFITKREEKTIEAECW